MSNTHDVAVDEKRAAEILGLAPATLRKMRSLGPQEKGLPAIPFVKYSAKCVRYIVSDLEAWRDGHRVNVEGAGV
jgi:hypothetical protein